MRRGDPEIAPHAAPYAGKPDTVLSGGFPTENFSPDAIYHTVTRKNAGALPAFNPSKANAT